MLILACFFYYHIKIKIFCYSNVKKYIFSILIIYKFNSSLILLQIIGIYIYYLENNIVMNYSDIFNFFIIILVIISMLTIFIKMPFHIILTSKVVNKDIKIDLNLRYMFNLINVNINIYPKKIDFKKKELKQSRIKRKAVENLKERKFFLKDILNICSKLKKIEIEEFYSNIHIGNTNVAITNFAYLFINLVYGNLINIIDSNKFYMNIKPNFIENKIYIDFKIHLKLTIKNIIDILKAIIITYKKAKYKRGG